MRAVVVEGAGGPEVARVREVARPTADLGEVVVEVVACGMCGHDQADRAGLTDVEFPVILGHEVAGTVRYVGPSVRHLRVGDRVAAKQFQHCGRCAECYRGRDMVCRRRRFTYGGYAEQVALPESSLLQVPDGLSLERAAVVACTVGTCLQALTDVAALQRGETVLVTGAGGGLGIHGVQVAKALGAEVIAATGSAVTADLKAADHVVQTTGDWWSEVMDITNGRGVQVVLDNVGHPAVFRQAFRSAARRGRYVFTGQVSGDPVRLHPAFLFENEVTLSGSVSTSMANFADALDLAARDEVEPVTTSYPLDSVVEAFTALDERRVSGRIVLIP